MRETRIGTRHDRGQGAPGDQLINVMLVIVVATAIGFIGTDVNAEIDDSTDVGPLDGEDVTVTNESVGTVTFNANDRFFYTVNDASRAATIDDDEEVFNTTSDTQLTEDTDYEWHTGNGTVELINTSEIGNQTSDVVITYNYTETENDFAAANSNLSSGYSDAMSLADIVFLVLMFSVILGALLVFRVRR